MVDGINDNSYYLAVEYPIIKNNTPANILPMEIQEKDGMQEIYYDVTGKVTLEEWGEKKQICFEDVKNVLESITSLFEELEEYLLSINQVSIRKNEIFVGTHNHIQWMYTPVLHENVQKDFEELFLWILSGMGFEDLKGANLIHKAFVAAKNQGICREFLEQSLDEFQEFPKQIDDEIPLSPHELDIKKPPKEKKKHHWKINWKKAGIIFMMILDFLAIVYWAYGFYRYGIQRQSICFFVGLVGLMIILAIILLWGRFHKTIPAKVIKEDRHQETPVHKSIFEELESQWGKGNETVFLSDAIPKVTPALYNEKTSQIVQLRVFPFYIGSEEGLNQLSIKNRTISRQHAVITKDMDDKYYLEDLESKNGTMVNGRKVLPETSTVLPDGSEITFANEIWTFYHDFYKT